MEGGAVLGRLSGADGALTPVEQRAPGQWQIGTVTAIRRETSRVSSFRIAVPMWMAHLPGQHYEVRLTAPDGYTAQRSYSIASSPLQTGEVELTIDRLDDGEVSPYFHDILQVGDQLELRGPFTSYFVWRGEQPVLLVGGGSGIVPLMAMLRHRRLTKPELPMRLVFSVRTAADVIYPDELGEETAVTYTREAPDGWRGHNGHIDEPMILDAIRALTPGPAAEILAFACGSNGFVESASRLLLAAGLEADRIRTERFGPTS